MQCYCALCISWIGVLVASGGKHKVASALTSKRQHWQHAKAALSERSAEPEQFIRALQRATLNFSVHQVLGKSAWTLYKHLHELDKCGK